MTKDEIKINNIKSFELNLKLKDKNEKVLLNKSIGEFIWSDFLYDLINNIRIKDWNKSNVEKKKGDQSEWSIVLTGKDGGIITFFGENSFPSEWENLMDLIELINKKVSGDEED